jgi:predicted nucleotidyltransferase
LSTLGLVVEYNPFHNGHLYHIKKSKSITGSEAVVAVMSGNFVQRGIPAVIDKWLRAEMALVNGVDLVLELPILYSLSSAEFFAFGAVSILNSIGIVDSICFGSECGNINILKDIAEILEKEPEPFKKFLKDLMNTGMVYPSARSRALVQYLGHKGIKYSFDPNDVMASPNNTLGIEYCRSILRLNSSIKPFSILREGSGYNSEVFEDRFSSATALRKHFKENKPFDIIDEYVPPNVMEMFLDLKRMNYSFAFSDSMFPFIKYRLLTMPNKYNLLKIPDISEGLENKICKSIETSENLDKLVEAVKSKRYTYTRISRILSQLFVGFEGYDTLHLRRKPCPYVRVLGFNSKGAQLLKEMKIKSAIPFYVKMPKEQSDLQKLDIQSTKAYSLINRNVDPKSDYLRHPIIV